MKSNKDIKVQTEVLTEIYTAMEFATAVSITYKKDTARISIQGRIHYLDFSTAQIRVVDCFENIHYVPLAMIKAILLLKENHLPKSSSYCYA